MLYSILFYYIELYYTILSYIYISCRYKEIFIIKQYIYIQYLQCWVWEWHQWLVMGQNALPRMGMDGMGESGRLHRYPLVKTNSLLLKMAIEIVDFPIKNGWIFP